MSTRSELTIVAYLILLLGILFVWCSTKQRAIDMLAMWIPIVDKSPRREQLLREVKTMLIVGGVLLIFLAVCTLLVSAFSE